MLHYLAWLEQCGFSRWMRESEMAFPVALLFHTLGLALLVGTNGMIDLRVLGVARSLPLGPMKRFFSLLWLGFSLNAISGVALLIAYPTKELTNPVFYVKLAFIALGLINMRLLGQQVFHDPSLDHRPVAMKGKILACTSLFFWIGAITTGRLLGYTYTHLQIGRAHV